MELPKDSHRFDSIFLFLPYPFLYVLLTNESSDSFRQPVPAFMCLESGRQDSGLVIEPPIVDRTAETELIGCLGDSDQDSATGSGDLR